MPGPVRLAAVLLAVEGAALSLLGVAFGIAGVVGDPDDRAFTYAEAAMVVALGVALLLLARAVAAERGWARSPAVTVQLLALPAGIGLAQNGVWWLAAVVLGLAGTVLYQLATPEARLAFDRRSR
jgi:hypothetical protein